ncbi:MAG: hypothetical protein ABSC20_12860 [Candidatus Bathyarchaeia archaeon]
MSLKDYSGYIRESFREHNLKDLVQRAWSPPEIRDYVYRAVLKRTLRMHLPPSLPKPNKVLRILAICCYMADRPNLADKLVESVEEAKSVKIDLVITNNTSCQPSNATAPYVKYTLLGKKFVSVERIIREQLKPYHNYVIIVDDDVKLPIEFFDKYFKIVNGFGLIVSQPAASSDSNAPCGKASKQITQSIAHLTQFVEIGPVTCFEKRAVQLCPFVGGSPMGWGLDFVWPRICREKRWPMGVVDFVPVQHKIREVAENYESQKEYLLMHEYLSKVAHVPFCSNDVIGQIIFVKDYPQIW